MRFLNSDDAQVWCPSLSSYLRSYLIFAITTGSGLAHVDPCISFLKWTLHWLDKSMVSIYKSAFFTPSLSFFQSLCWWLTHSLCWRVFVRFYLYILFATISKLRWTLFCYLVRNLRNLHYTQWKSWEFVSYFASHGFIVNLTCIVTSGVSLLLHVLDSLLALVAISTMGPLLLLFIVLLFISIVIFEQTSFGNLLISEWRLFKDEESWELLMVLTITENYIFCYLWMEYHSIVQFCFLSQVCLSSMQSWVSIYSLFHVFPI